MTNHDTTTPRTGVQVMLCQPASGQTASKIVAAAILTPGSGAVMLCTHVIVWKRQAHAASGHGSTLIEKVMSGGQTGVDRAVLDVAMDLGTPCGG